MTDAQEERSAPSDEPVPPLFLFRLADTLLLCPAACVDAVTSFEAPVPLPRVPTHVLGLVTYDQRALVLVDLARFLGLEEAEPGPRDRTLVVAAAGYRVGLPVDGAIGVVQLKSGKVRPGTRVFGGRLAEFARAEADTRAGLGAILDLETMLEAARA